MTLPAGLLPDDNRIEFFSQPGEFGKCFFIQNGHTRHFRDISDSVKNALQLELSADRKAKKGLRLMGIKDSEMLEVYNYCNRGRLDSMPDIDSDGKNRMTKEYVNCGRRGKCPGEHMVCRPLIIDGFKITFRERECWEHVSNRLDYKQIKVVMGFKQITTVNSLMQRIRMKTGCSDKVELAIKAREIGII